MQANVAVERYSVVPCSDSRKNNGGRRGHCEIMGRSEQPVAVRKSRVRGLILPSHMGRAMPRTVAVGEEKKKKRRTLNRAFEGI